jgi:HEAT repeat protein
MPEGMVKGVSEALLAALKDEGWYVRQAAANSLGALSARMPEGLFNGFCEVLLAALKDEDWRVRKAAANSLGALSAWMPEGMVKGVSEALLAALKDTDSDVRRAAANGLGALGAQLPEGSVKEFSQTLLLRLKNNQDYHTLNVNTAETGSRLSAWLPDELIQPFIQAMLIELKDKHADRGYAARALGEISLLIPEGSIRGVSEALLAALKDQDWDVRAGAARALNRLSVRLSVELSEELARNILKALVALNDKHADFIEAVTFFLPRLSNRLSEESVRSIGEALLVVLKHKNPDLTKHIANVLGVLSARLPDKLVQETGEALGEALLLLLKDGYKDGCAVIALGSLGAYLPEESVKGVIEALIPGLQRENLNAGIEKNIIPYWHWGRSGDYVDALAKLSMRLPVRELQFIVNFLLTKLNDNAFDGNVDRLIKTLLYLMSKQYFNTAVGNAIRKSLFSVAITPIPTSNSNTIETVKPPHQYTSTLPDGNCVMNAVALGICDLVLQHKDSLADNKFKTLLDGLNPLLSQKIVSTLLAWLEKETDSHKRQAILAPLLRELAVEYIESHVDYYKESYEAGLLAAFEQYKLNQFDDTFTVHTHIRKKFEELNALANIRNQSLDIKEMKEGQETQALLTWWNKGIGKNSSGFQEYLSHLKLPARGVGDRERWGSEVEIGALAFRLGINIKNVKPGIKAGQEQLLGVGYGCILGLSDSEIEHLVNLGIGSRFQGNFRIEIADVQELTQKLQLETLTDGEKAYLDKNGQETVLAFMGNVRHCPVPERAGMQELCEKLKRIGLFVQSKNQPLRFVNDAVLKSRLTPVTEALKKKVLAAHAQPPCFTIQHIGAHWSYMNKQKNDLEKISISQNSGPISSKDFNAALTFNRILPPANDRKAGNEKERHERWALDEKDNKDRRDEKEAVSLTPSSTIVSTASSGFSVSASSMSTSAAIMPFVPAGADHEENKTDVGTRQENKESKLGK